MNTARPPDPIPHAASQAIEAAGGCISLARRLGITRDAVQKWRSTGIPPARVGKVAQLTGKPVHQLRPDLFEAPR